MQREALVISGHLPLQSNEMQQAVSRLSSPTHYPLSAPSKENTRPMKLTARIPVTAAFVALLVFGATGCNQLKSRDQLNKGVQAFKNARYEEAVDHFQTAIKLDPNSADAMLYLATAYSYDVVAA